MLTKGLILGLLGLVLQTNGQGTGVNDRPEMDFCNGATGPRPLNEVFSPGTTRNATVDDVGMGFCGVAIDSPGIWWWVNGTGDRIRASSCDERTRIKIKISVFTGTCDALRCVTGSEYSDFECPLLKRGAGGEWGTLSTSVDFPTYLGFHYYILVQGVNGTRGDVWMNFRVLKPPQNNDCINAIGPLPKDMTQIPGTSVDASISDVPAGYCGAPHLYPGTWYQIMGTGGKLTVMACSEYNLDGFYFSVYDGGFCDSLTCVSGNYEANVEDEDRCSFGPAQVLRPMTKFTWNTKDLNRYYVYVHYARTAVDKPTSPYFLWADDGAGGKAGLGAANLIKFAASGTGAESDGTGDGSDGGKNGKGKGKNSSAASLSHVICLLAASIVGSLLI